MIAEKAIDLLRGRSRAGTAPEETVA
jgi:hypothetical protein